MTSQHTFYPEIVWNIENGEEQEIGGMEEACEIIHDSMEGWGTETDGLNEVLGAKNPTQRFIISKQYEEIYGEDLYEEVKDEAGGDYGRALKLLVMNPVDAEAKMVHDAIKGWGAREPHLIPLIVGRSNADLVLLKRAYFNRYENDMVMDLADNLDGDFEKLIVMCAQGLEEDYDPDVHNEDRIKDDCNELYESGQGSWGTDENTFFKILVTAPSEHLQAVQNAYVDEYGYSLKKIAEKELDGNVEDAIVHLLSLKLGKIPETYAAGIKSTTKGLGTDETGLINYIVRLAGFPALFEQVQAKHIEEYEKSIQTRLEGELSGPLLNLLLILTNNFGSESDE